MSCDDIDIVHQCGSIAFSILSFLIWLFGGQNSDAPGGPVYHAVSLSIYLCTLIYSAGSHSIGCLLGWARDEGLVDISLIRYALALIQISTFIVVMSFRPRQECLTVLVHILFPVINIGMWLASALAYEKKHRFFWAYGAIVLSITTFTHILGERSVFTNSRQMLYRRVVLIMICAYVVIYYVVVLWGPLYSDIVPTLAQEIVFTLCDIIFSLIIYLSVSHYTWAMETVRFEQQYPRQSIRPRITTFPNYVQALYATKQHRLIQDIANGQYVS